jgi:hypothetical protein
LSLPAEQIGSAQASRDGGRAFGLGPHVIARVGGVVLGLVLLVAVVRVLLAGPGGSAARHSGTVSPHGNAAATHIASAAKYGGLPSWLPKAKVPVERVLSASPAHPALAIQGNTVSVHLARGQVLATAVGPTVPESGRFPVPATSPCTFILTFAHASGVIPLSAKAFTFIDELGHVRHPRVTAIGGGALPRLLVPGRPVSLRVYDVLPTGDGGLTWAPGGGRPIVSWDFDVEID